MGGQCKNSCEINYFLVIPHVKKYFHQLSWIVPIKMLKTLLFMSRDVENSIVIRPLLLVQCVLQEIKVMSIMFVLAQITAAVMRS